MKVREDFLPRTETFIDCAGIERKFIISEFQLSPSPDGKSTCETGYLLDAQEVTDKDGYLFSFWSPCFGDCFEKLCSKVRTALATRYIVPSDEGALRLTHNKIVGRIAPEGMVIDGVMYDWERITGMLRLLDRNEFELRIVEPSD